VAAGPLALHSETYKSHVASTLHTRPWAFHTPPLKATPNIVNFLKLEASADGVRGHNVPCSDAHHHKA
jgi:hypothetical protein